MGPRSQNSFFESFCTSHEVSIIINLFKTKLSGIRDVPIFIYKRFCTLLSPWISYLFNLSISEGVFPDALKESRTVPIFKKGNSKLSDNYRPISTIHILAKIFEKLMSKRLYSYLNKYKILFSSQFGFRTGSSTTDAIIQYLDSAYKTLHFKSFRIFKTSIK